MKDYTQEQLEAGRPHFTHDAVDLVDFCLHRLYIDRNKSLHDELAYGLTYEELIGALLLARDELTARRFSALAVDNLN